MSHSAIPDQSARDQALDPYNSYIVQAPAGSGKTELLTQRYLVLLAHVQQVPEEIIAITFTRKAAAEMRGRVLSALGKARTEPRPEQPHAQKTWELARRALAKDQALKWHILENPNRLRIFTIDSLCTSLARQMPVLSGLGGATTIAEDPFPLYEQAARRLLASLETDAEWTPYLENLLLHLDNDHARAERLLIDMLAKRDQWLPYLSASKDARHLFETALSNVLLENIEKAAHSLPAELIPELIELTRFAANNLAQASASETAIVSCCNLTTLPEIALTDYQKWLGIANLLLTQTKQWRKKITQKEGFPAPSSCKDKTAKTVLESMKRRIEHLLERCAALEPLRQALQDLLESPPTHYTDSQWEIIDSLLELLPLLAAYLRVEFQAQGRVDYIEIANSASAAFGETDNPTDLALTLDYRIQHILVDEFQDTSSNQYRLLEQLTMGWEPGDGRTLFLVGDPMQSIYRFRKAEVGLFLRARELGIGNVILEPLSLSANFRSHQTIVNWVNTTFQALLPQVEDIGTGAVAYHPSVAIHQDEEPSQVSIYPFYTVNFAVEALQVVEIIQQTLAANPKAAIAILVRAKTHLFEILPALQNADIAYKAVDIDPLFNRPVIQDLLALTQALLHFGDRTAWLALLRAPWCGLTLEELYHIVGTNHEMAVWDQLQHYAVLNLNAATKQRLERLLSLLRERLSYRRRLSLRRWIEGTWIALGGPACLTSRTDLQDAQTFFELLGNLAEGGDIADFEQLYSRLQRLYAAPNTQQQVQVEIMSIHKSKGLEFDTVILPGLGRELPNDDPQLLLWMERPKRHGGTDLLVAPIRASHEEFDPIYNYLRLEEAKKNHFETGRLLYVAATRAKKHLHLLGHCLTDNTQQPPMLLKPAKRSLLTQLWNQVEASFQLKITHSSPLTPDPFYLEQDKPNLKRLTLDWQLPVPVAQTALLAKIQTHNLSSTIAELPLPYPYLQIHQVLRKTLPYLFHQSLTTEQFTHYYQTMLLKTGVNQADIATCLSHLQNVAATIIEDQHAAWLFKFLQNGQAAASITLYDKDKFVQQLIDWQFKDENQQSWWVYYNFLAPNGNNPEDFIAQEISRYQPMLQRLLPLEQGNAALGIYFPLLARFVHLDHIQLKAVSASVSQE